METTPITPVDLYTAQQPLGDASLVAPEDRSGSPTVIERLLRRPLWFWFAETLLFTPVALFLLQGFLHEIGQRALSNDINLFLFGTGHTIVGDILGPLVLPMVGIVVALARIRDARAGRDRKATIWLAMGGIAAIGIVLAYAVAENIGHLLR